jgi:hypothetical protein
MIRYCSNSLLEDASGAACKWTGTGKGTNATGGAGWRPWLDLEVRPTVSVVLTVQRLYTGALN